MRVIPVLDLKGGLVVHAVRGERQAYRPIDTPLAPGTAAPRPVARALLGACEAFDTLYVADLDAIMGRGNNRKALCDLLDAMPGVSILLDDGSANIQQAAKLAEHPRITPVIGTESLDSPDDLADINEALKGSLALSLDWRGDTPLGAAQIHDTPALWPDCVIVMSLERVGAGAGPDVERLKQVRIRAGSREILAAGGVRNIDDLRHLREMRCGALIATALHNGSLSRDDLYELLSK